MAIFNSKLLVYQRVYLTIDDDTLRCLNPLNRYRFATSGSPMSCLAVSGKGLPSGNLT